MPKLGTSPVPFGPKPAGCSNFELLIARGTSEPGPFGVIVGDPLVRAVSALIPGTRGYAVQYPADATATSVSTGSNDTVARLAAQDLACPQQKFALVGYSQGAGVMRRATPSIPPGMQQSKILAMAMFGDPGLKRNSQFPATLQAKLLENCAVGDPVCTQGSDFNPHLTYNSRGTTYMQDSAKFIAAAFKGTPMPASPIAPKPGQAAPTGTPKAGAPPKAAPSKAPAPPAAVPVAVPPKGPTLGTLF
ncbi:alpha/beta-hydrolase [Tothia fuscella]|uniref:Alpha/beta-hydrolase n=1 Tax=Tothia fuscella TaxID=1048955 RepID=A0A9P4U2T3_9PEZI|nr:alpha/beta-hydrolase [Tothia fuscella]